MSRDHTVIIALRENTKIRPADLDFIIENGQNYRGVSLPAGVRRWPMGDCVLGAQDFEDRGLGRFTSGYVLRSGTRRPIPHSWASRDGTYALDPTLADAVEHAYWGLAGKHHDRLNTIAAHTFRGTTSAGIPVDLARGGFKIPGLQPFRFRL
ncbi:hypothetical protein ACQKQD_23825 [Methylobacterium sp. NPDC080182]|uniref:hypothetical protein n=1 Tax=Methylobacterium sp. NPDC080182 TaxID=3390590 RepID=UPI003D0289B6